MELARVLQAVWPLRRACHGEDFVLHATEVIDGIVRVLTADMIWFDDIDARANEPVTLILWPRPVADETRGASRRDLSAELTWTGASGAGHALVMPLPAPPGSCRRLVFVRRPGCAFSDEDRSAAVLLQPHIADALRLQSRSSAARLLTGRQRELLRLVAAGCDNVEIARQLGLSPYTVRKHLENAFARLDVTSRTAAVAKVCPDTTWLDPPATGVPATLASRASCPRLLSIKLTAAAPPSKVLPVG